MTSGKSALCRDFENEMWLFIANELPAERIEFWKKHLSECDGCLKEMEEELKTASAVAKETEIDLDDASFNRMINVAVEQKTFSLKNIFGIKNVFKETKNIYGKAAFAGVLALVAIIITIVTHQSIPVKNIPQKVLDWNGTDVTNQIDEIKNQINFISEDNWDKQILLIDKKIEKIKNQSDKFSFN